MRSFVCSTAGRASAIHGQIIECLKPQGQLACIDDMEGLDVMKMKSKSISLHWELMFTRPMYRTNDMNEQGRLLLAAAAMVDGGLLRSTMTASLGRNNASNLREAHRRVESGETRGKIVLEGF